jgi:SAM-dependent methyltransferase
MSQRNSEKFLEYSRYLRGRTLLGKIYRRFWLYPMLSRHLNGVVLDIGCGVGDFLSYRARSVGVDINPCNVEYCRQLALDARVMEDDQLPIDDLTFDTVLLDNVLEHIDTPEPLLFEIARVLRPSGSLIIGVPGVRGYSCDTDHVQFYDEKDLIYLARRTGFSIVYFFYMPLWRSNWLSRHVRQYCIYSLWQPALGPKHV